MTDAQGTTAPELAKAIHYAQKLLDTARDVVGAAPVHIDVDQAMPPKIMGLTILCRSISNFRAAMLLVQQKQVLEASALVRLMYENLLWLAALQERGLKFVQDMLNDDAFNRKKLFELALELEGTQGGDVSGPGALEIQTFIKDLRRFPPPKKLDARNTAAKGAVEVYFQYGRLSLVAVHCSITALWRHISIDGVTKVELRDLARTEPDEVLSTVLHACGALLATARGTDELIGFTSARATLAALETEFVSNGWLEYAGARLG